MASSASFRGPRAPWIGIPLLIAAAGLTLGARALAQTAPPGFVVENAFPSASFTDPVQVVFLPDGRRLVAEVRGVVWMILLDGTQLPQPFIDISGEVRTGIDLGLLGVAIDPDFAANRWVYLAYTVNPDADGDDLDEDQFCRVTRYRAGVANPNVADPSTRQVLIGATWPEGIPSLSLSHSIGALRFGADKTLLIGSGDGAQFKPVDRGGFDPGGFGPGRTDPAEDMGAFRSRSLNSLAGKVLRVDKETGLGLSSNPYWDGAPASDRSRVWLYGLRNPFRFSIRPGTGSPDPQDGDPGVVYIGDVGWDDFEELHIATAAGLNLGWPCHEGPLEQPGYQAVTSTECGNTNVLCGAPASSENPAPPTGPQLWWHHAMPTESNPEGWIGATAIGGVFYTATHYPSQYQGRYYLADYAAGWIRAIEVDAADNVVGWSEFIADAAGPVDIEADPLSGDLFYVAIFAQQVRRIRFGTIGVDEPAAAGAQLRRPVLAASRPNPFGASASIGFELPAAAKVTLGIYDSRGRLVRRLADRSFGVGRHAVEWDGRDQGGRLRGAGVYFYRLEAGGRVLTRKLVRLE